MTTSKKELRTELGCQSVAMITSILQIGDRPYQQSSLSSEDADFVRDCYKLIKAGHSVVDAVRIVNGGKTDTNTNTTAENYATSQTTELNTKRRQIQIDTLRQEVTEDAVQREQAYWYLLAAAQNSEQVQNDERVQSAIATYQYLVTGRGRGEEPNFLLAEAVSSFEQLKKLPGMPAETPLLLTESWTSD